MNSAAVERRFEIIGEAISQLAKYSPELAARVPNWRGAIGFRNILIHGYAMNDDTRVWQIAQVHVPRRFLRPDPMLFVTQYCSLDSRSD